MKSAQVSREQTRNEPPVVASQKGSSFIATVSRWPPTLDDARSPALHLDHHFGASKTLGPQTLQPKVTGSEPGDHEQEADRPAEQVMRMPDLAGRLQRQCGCGGAGSSGESCQACGTQSGQLQRATPAGTSSNAATPSVMHDVLRGPGQPSRLVTEFLLARTMQAKLAVASEHDAHEQIADRAAAEVVDHQDGAGRGPAITELRKGSSSFSGAPAAGHVPELPNDAGRPLSAATRRFAETAFGHDFSQVRLHGSSTAQKTAASLGARAFTHGQDIWLGPRESESDKPLMAHELAHVVQQGQGTIYLRSATWVERRAWLSFFSHPVPRRLLNNYMDDTGAAVNLSLREMIGCNPVVDLRRSPAFLAAVASHSGGGAGPITVSGWGGALTNGTLGNFTINYTGQLTVAPAGGWSFTGTMNFFDFWDFDPKPFGSGSGRPTSAEIKVRVAAAALPGRPFNVTSVQVPVSQTNADTRATWAGGTPTPVTGPAARSAVDIEAGAAGGVGLGGPVGAAGGGEVGAQASEDLNR